MKFNTAEEICWDAESLLNAVVHNILLECVYILWIGTVCLELPLFALYVPLCIKSSLNNFIFVGLIAVTDYM